MDDLAQICEQKLESAQFVRKWLIVPSICISSIMLICGASPAIWLIVLAIMLWHLWANSQEQKNYLYVIALHKRRKQLDSIHELNPHRK